MTREERENAIDIIQSILDKYEEDECLATEITIGDEDIEVLKMAIKALEHEPISFQWCTDCKEYDQEKHCCHRWSKVIRDTVEEMKQEPRKGHWIRVAGGSLIDDYRCDCCNHQPPVRKVGSTWGWDFTDYCPNCGAKMVEPQESEVENGYF